MEKSIKLVAFDMDGTVLDSKLRLPKGLFEMIESHPNVKFVVASGRQYYSLLNIFNPIKDKLIFISENGGIIMEKDKVIHIMLVPDDKALEVLDLVSEDKGIYPVLGCEKTSYIENPPEYVMNDVAQYNVRLETVDDIKSVVGKDNILNLALYCHKRAKDNILPKLADISGDLKAVLSAESWVDVINANVNKGNAIKVIQEIFGISPEECVAFGDYMNDYEMLQNCGESYAMENAHDEIKKVAKQEADQLIREAQGKAKEATMEIEKDIAIKTKELDDLQKQFDVYKAKMESLLISQLELLKDSNKE